MSVCIVAASRLISSVARDGILPGSSWIGKVDKNGMPTNAVYFIWMVRLSSLEPSEETTADLSPRSGRRRASLHHPAFQCGFHFSHFHFGCAHHSLLRSHPLLEVSWRACSPPNRADPLRAWQAHLHSRPVHERQVVDWSLVDYILRHLGGLEPYVVASTSPFARTRS